MRAEEALRPVESEAGPVLRATGSPQTQTARESQKKPGDGARVGARPAQGLPSVASASLSPPLAGRGGARHEHKRLQLPSGRRPTPPTPGPGPARGEEVGRKRQGGRERARMGRAGDPGPRARVGEVRGEGAGSYSGSRDSKNGRKKEFLKIGSGPRNEVGDRKGTRNTPHTPKETPAASTHPRGEVWKKPRARKKAVPPHSGAEGREEGRGRTRPRGEKLSTRAGVAPAAATAPSASLSSNHPTPAPLRAQPH